MPEAPANAYVLVVNVFRGAYDGGRYTTKWAAKQAMLACINPSVVSFTIIGPLGKTLYSAKGEPAGTMGH